MDTTNGAVAPLPQQQSARKAAGTSESAQAAAARWMREHADALWRFCKSRTGSSELSEEIVQETLLAAMRGHASFAGKSSERTWLLSIASNKIADHFRRAARRGEKTAVACPDGTCGVESIESLFDEQGRWKSVPRSWALADARDADHEVQVRALRACVDALPPEQAEPIWLRELLGVPPEHVCKELGLTPTNLWTRLHRARHALRRCLERSIGSVEREGKERRT
jgi:RNA polymerase sigma-70 factor (ECF subfamily)